MDLSIDRETAVNQSGSARHYLIAVGNRSDPTIPNVGRDLDLIVRCFCKRERSELWYEHALRDLTGKSPTVDELRRSLSAWFCDLSRMETDKVLIYFSGHGESADRHYLLLSDSEPERLAGTAFPTEDFVRIIAESSGARDVLLILDTCYSGRGISDLQEVAARIGLRPERLFLWIATALPKQEARDGPFAREFVQAVGNADSQFGRRGQEYLNVDAVVAAVNNKLKGQSANWNFAPAQRGSLRGVLRNLQYRPGLSPGLDIESQNYYEHYRGQLAAHWQPRAAGAELATSATAAWYFTGRERALTELVKWLNESQPASNTVVVTGDPGTGKSALLARLVTLADPDIRRDMERMGALRDLPAETIPHERSIDVAVHARGRTLRQVVQILAESLGLQDLDEGLERVGDEEVIALGVRSIGKFKGRVVILMDALDEAAQPKEVTRLLRELVHVERVKLLVGSRPDTRPRTGGPRFVGLGPNARLIDLDHPDYVGQDDIAIYAKRRLLALEEPEHRTPYRERPQVVEPIAKAVAAQAGNVFLIARIVCRNLIDAPEPLDLSEPGWEKQIPSDLSDAFDQYLERFDRVAGLTKQKALDLLAPLAYAQGQGWPWENLWAPMASSLSGNDYSDSDIRNLLECGGALIVESIEYERSVYRLYHQALGEFMRKRDGESRAVELHRRFADTLTRLTPEGPGGSKDWLRAHPYTQTHLAVHAARASQLDELLIDARFLLAADPVQLIPVVSETTSEEGRRAANWYALASDRLRGAAPAERASYLELVARQNGASDLARRVNSVAVNKPWSVPRAQWRPATAHRVIGTHPHWVFSLTLGNSEGREVVVSGSADGTILRWDLGSGASIGEPLRGHKDSVWALAVADLDGKAIVVSRYSDATIRMWDLATGAPFGEPRLGQAGAVNTLAVATMNGRALVVTGSHDGFIRAQDLASGAPVCQPLPAHEGGALISERGVTALTVGEVDGRVIVVSAGKDLSIRRWDLGSAAPIGEPLRGHLAEIRALAVAERSGRATIVSGSNDSTIRVWDLATGTPIGEPLRGHAYQVGTLAVAERNGRAMVVSGGGDTTIRVWDLASSAPIGEPLRGHQGVVNTLAVSGHQGRAVVVSGSDDQTIRVWDMASAAPIGKPLSRDEDRFSVLGTAELNGQAVVVSLGRDFRIRVTELTSGSVIGVPTGVHEVRVTAVAVASLNRCTLVISACADGKIRLWDLASGALIVEPLQAHEEWVEDLAVTEANGRALMVSCSWDGTIREWDLASGAAFCEPLRRHKGSVRVLCATKFNGRNLVLSGGDDGTIRVWNPARGAAFGKLLRGHQGSVYALCTAKIDGRDLVVSGGEDGTIRVWDLASRASIGEPLRGHQGLVHALCPAELDGRNVVVSGSADETIRVWDLASHTLIGRPIRLGYVRATNLGNNKFVCYSSGFLLLEIHPGYF